jgi:hypothetical protein
MHSYYELHSRYSHYLVPSIYYDFHQGIRYPFANQILNSNVSLYLQGSNFQLSQHLTIQGGMSFYSELYSNITKHLSRLLRSAFLLYSSIYIEDDFMVFSIGKYENSFRFSLASDKIQTSLVCNSKSAFQQHSKMAYHKYPLFGIFFYKANGFQFM